jgi:hypothetical protein
MTWIRYKEKFRFDCTLILVSWYDQSNQPLTNLKGLLLVSNIICSFYVIKSKFFQTKSYFSSLGKCWKMLAPCMQFSVFNKYVSEVTPMSNIILQFFIICTPNHTIWYLFQLFWLNLDISSLHGVLHIKPYYLMRIAIKEECMITSLLSVF